MLQNVDEIMSQPFPVNVVFNLILTNFEVGFIFKLQPFLGQNMYLLIILQIFGDVIMMASCKFFVTCSVVHGLG